MMRYEQDLLAKASSKTKMSKSHKTITHKSLPVVHDLMPSAQRIELFEMGPLHAPSENAMPQADGCIFHIFVTAPLCFLL